MSIESIDKAIRDIPGIGPVIGGIADFTTDVLIESTKPLRESLDPSAREGADELTGTDIRADDGGYDED